MKKTTKLISFFLSVFISCLVIILFSEKTYMMNTFKGETINVEDLRVGDYIENGAYLSTSNNYSFVDGGNLNNVLSLCFSKLDDDTCDEEDKIYSFSNSSPYLVDSYDKLFGTTTNYSGWKYKIIRYSGKEDPKFYLIFVPTSEYSKITNTPTKDNEYKTSAQCSAGSQGTYTWYKNKKFDLTITDSYGKSTIFDSAENLYNYLIEDLHSDSGNIHTITFNFTAEKGDFFTFDIGFLAKTGYSSVTYPHLLLNIFHNSNNDNANSVYDISMNLLYNTLSFEITESGKQTIKLGLYEYKIVSAKEVEVYLKNPKLLSVLNEDATLNKSALVNGQSLYYETTCEDGYVLSGTLDYVGDENLNIDTNGDGEADLNIDTDGDGKADINIDVDGDGTPDINIDTNGDGKSDLNIDSDGNGIVDTEEIDNPNTGAFIGFSITIITLILLTILYIKNDYKKFRKI